MVHDQCLLVWSTAPVFVFVSKYHGIRADGFGCSAAALYAVDRSVSRLFWQWMSENTDVDAVAVKYGAWLRGSICTG